MPRICTTTLVALALAFVSPSLQSTHYASEDDSAVVQSIQPCHIYGDPDLYGLGVRLSFYLQWVACMIAIAGDVKKELFSSRKGINIVSTAVLINVVNSAKAGSFAILELFITSTLVVLLPFFFVVPQLGFLRDRTEVVADRRARGITTFKFYEPGAISGRQELKDDPIGLGYFLLLNSAFLLMQPWFYYKLIHQGHKAGCEVSLSDGAFENAYSAKRISLMRKGAIFSAISVWFYFGCALFCFKCGMLNVIDGEEPKASANQYHEPITAGEENGPSPDITSGIDGSDIEGRATERRVIEEPTTDGQEIESSKLWQAGVSCQGYSWRLSAGPEF